MTVASSLTSGAYIVNKPERRSAIGMEQSVCVCVCRCESTSFLVTNCPATSVIQLGISHVLTEMRCSGQFFPTLPKGRQRQREGFSLPINPHGRLVLFLLRLTGKDEKTLPDLIVLHLTAYLIPALIKKLFTSLFPHDTFLVRLTHFFRCVKRCKNRTALQM